MFFDRIYIYFFFFFFFSSKNFKRGGGLAPPMDAPPLLKSNYTAGRQKECDHVGLAVLRRDEMQQLLNQRPWHATQIFTVPPHSHHDMTVIGFYHPDVNNPGVKGHAWTAMGWVPPRPLGMNWWTVTTQHLIILFFNDQIAEKLHSQQPRLHQYTL